MKMFVRSVITGFGLSLGAALFRKVSDRLGLSDDKDKGKRGDKDDKVVENAPGVMPQSPDDPTSGGDASRGGHE